VESAAPPVPAPANKTELLVSLRHLLRGLSSLFWGLPLALLACVPSAITIWLKPMGIVPSLIATGFLLFGIVEMGQFRKNERMWQQALDRAKIFALVNVGLSPFIFYLNRMPGEMYYRQMIWVMGGAAMLYVFNLNRSLKHLSAMLPDQTLREDTELFTSMNHGLMVTLLLLVALYFGLRQLNELPLVVIQFLVVLEQHSRWLLIFLVLLPVAMTMSLLWKIKEIVLTGIFGGHG
jgi:hypothetical protein